MNEISTQVGEERRRQRDSEPMSLRSKTSTRGSDARKDAAGTAWECRVGPAEVEDSACFFSDISFLFSSRRVAMY